MTAETPMIVKVGGSLYDLPNLGARLRVWLERLPTRRVLLVSGGGAAADWIRDVDRLDHLGEESCHWLALRAMTLTAHVLAARIETATVIEDIEDRKSVWKNKRWPVLDMYAFAQTDDRRPDCLPHRWDATSDALAARAALVAGIGEIVLLKSVSLPAGCDWYRAAQLGIVDATLPHVLATTVPPLRVHIVNFRQEPW